MQRWKKYTMISVASILALMLLSMLIVPWQLKVQSRKWFAANTTRQLSIEKAFFNPFTLSLEINGLKLTEQSSEQPFVSFDRLLLSISARSLIDLALILDRIELDKPYVNIVLLGKQEFNFSDFTRLGKQQPQTPPIKKEKPGRPFLFSLNNIVITGGHIDFRDQAAAQPSHHTITNLSLSVPFIGNVPYLADQYVQPQLHMLLNGSDISAAGQLKPFKKTLETSVSLALSDIDLPFYAYNSPIPLPLEVESGILNTQLDLKYSITSSGKTRILLGGELSLRDIDLRQLNNDELFRMPSMTIDLDWADLMQLDFNLASIDISEPEFFIQRDKQGKWNFEQLFPRKTDTQKPETASADTSATALPLLHLARLCVVDGKIHFRDQLPTATVVEELHGINLTLNDLSTVYNDKTGLTFSCADDRHLTTEVNGELGINPPSAAVDLVVNGVGLKPYYPYLTDFLRTPLSGKLDLASHINYMDDGNIQLQDASLALHKFHAPFIKKDKFNLNELTLTGGSFDLHQRQATVEALTLNGGDIRASRLADGSLSPLALLKKQPRKKQTGEKTPEFAVTLKQFDLHNFALHFTDASQDKKPRLEIKQLAVAMKDICWPQSRQSPFNITAKVGKRGKIALSGKVAHTPLRLSARAKIKALQLSDYNDFLPGDVKTSLKDGKLYCDMAVRLKEQGNGPQGQNNLRGSFGGKVTVNDFALRDPIENGDLINWQSLNLDGIKGEIVPFKLGIKKVALSKYMAKIKIDPQGRINLANLREAEPQAEETAASEKPAEANNVAKNKATSSEPATDIRIDDITLQGGTVSFTDRSMPTAFNATMYKLGGRITGMSSDENMQADVDLRGELENHSPLTITGKLNPLSRETFADLTIKFKDIDLAPMTPYSGTYLGYVIDRGKLYLDLNYHIEHGLIKAENKVMIDQFNFGDSVASDKATSLPVGLAIALLKDSNDEINLDIPVSGDLNDPDFSIAGTILTILKNLLVKAATSPFALLGSMLGEGGEDFTNLPFDSGIARLNDHQRSTLAKLADMLKKRPALILEISAFVDRDNDPEAYRKDQLMQQMIDAKWHDLKQEGKAEQSRDLVSISKEEYPKYLLTVYKKAEFPRPRNFIGMLKKLPPAEMKKLLLSHIRADDDVMHNLANKRAQMVRDALIDGDEALKPQIFLKTVDIYQPAEKGASSRVEFNITAK